MSSIEYIDQFNFLFTFSFKFFYIHVFQKILNKRENISVS